MEEKIKNKKELTFPEYQTVSEYRKCESCGLYKRGKCSGNINHLGQCKKIRNPIMVTEIGGTTAVLGLTFFGVYSISQRLLLSLLITLGVACPMDLFSTYFEKNLYKKIFTSIEAKRRAKYTEELKKFEQLKALEEMKNKPSDLQQEKYERLKALNETFESIYFDMKNISEKNKNSFSTKILKMFDTIRQNFNELTNKITPKDLDNFKLDVFFGVHIDNFIELSKAYINSPLTDDDKEEYLALAKIVNNKILNILGKINGFDSDDFSFSVRALSKAINDYDKDFDEKENNNETLKEAKKNNDKNNSGKKLIPPVHKPVG